MTLQPITIQQAPEIPDETVVYLRRAAAKAKLPAALQVFTPPEVAAMLGVSTELARYIESLS